MTPGGGRFGRRRSVAVVGVVGGFRTAELSSPRSAPAGHETTAPGCAMLRVVTCAAVHFLIAESPPNALTRITVPLSILAVAGWSVCRHGCACRLPWRWWRPCWRWLCFNVTGGIYQVDASESYTNNLPGGMLARQLLILWHDQSAGLRYLERLR